jgi:hypothetical protein
MVRLRHMGTMFGLRPPCTDRYVRVVQQSPLSNPMREAPPVPIAHGL